MHELVPLTNDRSAGGALVDPVTLYMQPTARQRQMLAKPLPTEKMVAEVVRNNPLPSISRCDIRADDCEASRMTEELLARFFPSFPSLGPDFHHDMSDDELDKLVKTAVASYNRLGMTVQSMATEREASNFKGARSSLALLREEGLFRSGTFIPYDLLPDLFMATPVWYFAKKTGDDKEPRKNSRDPLPETLRHFCDIVPTERWSDLFLLFNYRIRSLTEYQGEFIPISVLERIKKATATFDYVVVATPYHDVAASDWAKIPWNRIQDPYVLGFQNGLPFAFVLDRYSGSGVFPLYHEMVADTIHFLRINTDKLRIALKGKLSIRWYDSSRPEVTTCEKSHTEISQQLLQTLAAFDRGELFGWLRGETPLPV